MSCCILLSHSSPFYHYIRNIQCNFILLLIKGGSWGRGVILWWFFFFIKIRRHVDAKLTINRSQVGQRGFKLTVLIPPFVISQPNREKHTHSCFLNCYHPRAPLLPCTLRWHIRAPALTHALSAQSRTSQAAGRKQKLPLSYNLLFILVLQPAETCSLPG